jgi:hypothetical protein
VGESFELEDEVRADMKTFVLSNIYAESADVTCGQARAFKWHKLKKKSTIRLPPDDDSLDLHVERKNYITYCQLHYNLLEHPSPIGHGWQILNGKCRPVRHTLPPCPISSHLVIVQMRVTMRVVAMKRGVNVENQQIQLKSSGY